MTNQQTPSDEPSIRNSTFLDTSPASLVLFGSNDPTMAAYRNHQEMVVARDLAALPSDAAERIIAKYLRVRGASNIPESVRMIASILEKRENDDV